jgi:predicted Zn finger-like uncharacterized protein
MPETTAVGCPNCGAKFKIPVEKLGKTFKCPKCAQPFVATALESTPPAAPVAPSSPARVASSSAVRLDEPPPVRAPRVPKQPVVEAAAEPAYESADEPGYAPPPAPRSTGGTPPGSGIAIAALICSLCIWPVGLVLGIIGLSKAKKGTAGGRGMSLAAVIIGVLNLVFTIGALVVGVPWLKMAVERANRAQCASNMHDIGRAMVSYAGTYDVYPPDLTTLAKAEHLDPKLFVCPSSSDKPAASVDQIESGGHCSYVYTGRNLSFGAGFGDIMFDDDANHGGAGGNVLNSDGSAQWKDKAVFEPDLAAAKAAAATRTVPPKNALKKF